MRINGITKVTKSIQNVLDKHSPEILTSIGIAGMISTTIMAVRATPKAILLIEEEKVELGVEELNTKEIVKTCWRCYIPATITGGISIACLIGANTVNNKRNALLATAYKLSETTLTEYRNKVVEVIGDKKEGEIREAISKDRVDNNPVNEKEIYLMGSGDSLCYDNISGRYFKSDMNKMQRAENTLNRRLMNEVYVSLNEFYDLLGLPPTQMGETLGWKYEGDLVELRFDAILSEKGEPCIVIDYTSDPKYGYQNLI